MRLLVQAVGERVRHQFDNSTPGRAAGNLVTRAVAATRTAVGGGHPGGPGPAPALALRLEKRIPVAAGLGGGSSDAAAAIDGAVEAWGAELAPEARERVAASLGSDVPFFRGGPALVEGRGERVAPLHGLRGAPASCWSRPRWRSRPRTSSPRSRLRGAGDGSVPMSSTPAPRSSGAACPRRRSSIEPASSRPPMT